MRSVNLNDLDIRVLLSGKSIPADNHASIGTYILYIIMTHKVRFLRFEYS